MRQPQLRKLFAIAWQRIVHKAAYSTLIAIKLGYHPAEQILMASVLCEVGTLAVLSALKDQNPAPSEKVYFSLCREYSKSLSLILLKKWNLNEIYVDTVRASGKWNIDTGPSLTLVDIINLGLYHTIINLVSKPSLPSLKTLSCYKKIFKPLNELDDSGQLKLIELNKKELSNIIQSIR